MALVAIAVAELHIPGALSLKDKRRTVRALIDRLYNRHRVSIAEIGYLDTRQRAQLGLAVVGRSDHEVDRLMDKLRTLIEESPEAVVTRWDLDVVDLS